MAARRGRGRVRQPRILAEGGELVGVDRALEGHRGLEHLEILSRQQLARLRDVYRVSGQLHAVLRSAERCRADALPRRQQPPGQAPFVDTPAQRSPEPPAQIAEIALFTAVDVLADAAREHDAFYAR